MSSPLVVLTRMQSHPKQRESNVAPSDANQESNLMSAAVSLILFSLYECVCVLDDAT